MKICIPKSIFTQCQSVMGDCQVLAIDFFMPTIDFYLSVAGNGLVVLGYIFGKMHCEDYNPCLMASFLILFGHFLAMISDTFTVIEDLFYLKQLRRGLNVNRYFVIANILSIIGEYQELKTSLHNTQTMSCR